ncbi:MAG: hypothetical protein ACXWQ5_00460 [Ktedonobacterales bacterium]
MRRDALELLCMLLFGVAVFEGMLFLLDHGDDTAALVVLVVALLIVNVYVRKAH